MPWVESDKTDPKDSDTREGMDLLDALAIEGMTLAAGVALVAASLASLLSFGMVSSGISPQQLLWHGFFTMVGTALLVRAFIVHQRIRRRLGLPRSNGAPPPDQTPNEGWPASFWQAFEDFPRDFERPPQHRQTRESFDP